MITPIEIRQHSFKKGFRGFDTEEVNSFLNTLSLEWEKVHEELKRTKIELDKTQTQLDSLKKVESVLHKTLLQAEQTSKTTIENAKKNAELKMQEAEGRSKDIMSSAMQNRSRVEIQINELTNQRNEILQQMKVFLTAQADRLNNFEEKEMKSIRKEQSSTGSGQEAKEGSFFEKSMQENQESEMVNEIVEELK